MPLPHRALPPLLVGLAMTTACGIGDQSTADKQRACADIARVIAPLQLDADPTEKATADVANNLDPKLASLRDVSAHDAAVRLHQQLHAYEIALRTQRGNADEALGRAREALDDLAKACDMPTASFLSPPAATP